MNKKVVEYQLGGVISLPASCANAEEKLLNAIIAVVEARGGQIGGEVVRRLTAEDYAIIEAEMRSWTE